MAVHAGVWAADRRPLGDVRRRVVQGVTPLAPDGVHVVADDPGLVMVVGACHVWTGDAANHQAVVSPHGWRIAWDGRLDNRDELGLRLFGNLAHARSDAALALSALEAWGTDGLAALVGEWSLAAWDPGARTVWLARDYLGIRPLYYTEADGVLHWSTSLGELVVRTGRVDELDEAFIARVMALGSTPHVTPYRAVHGVPPAACLVAADGRAPETRRYWTVRAGRLRHRDPRDYAADLRGLWQEAVAVRLRAPGTVWADLSGGLDSSAVVCMAQALIAAGRVDAVGLETQSHVTLESPEGDERRFIAEVEQCTGVSTHVVGAESHDGDVDADNLWVTPLASSGVSWAARTLVRQHGARLILSGRFGDTIMGNAPDNSIAVLDALEEGRWGRAAADLRLWSRATQMPFIRLAARNVGEAVRHALGLPPVHAPHRAQRAGLDVLTPALARIVEGGLAVRPWDVDVSASQRALADQVALASHEASLGPANELGDITYTYPFGHRPLVAFMLSIPGEIVSAPGETRALMRRAFAELVPARVLRRRSKGHYPPAAVRAARRVADTLQPVTALEVVERGWIDPARLQAALDRLLNGPGDADDVVRRVHRLEAWLQARERRAPAVIPQRKEVISDEVLDT